MSTAAYEVAFATNLGGDAIIDSEGIIYGEDNCTGGWIGDWQNKSNKPNNVSEADMEIYKTIRYIETEFRCNIPITKDGHYALVIKSSAFSSDESKWNLDVILNEEHKILSDMDPVAKHGDFPGYDEFIYFTVCNNTLMYKNQNSTITKNAVRVEFKSIISQKYIAAIVLLKGTIGERKKLSNTNNNEDLYFDPTDTPCNGEISTTTKPTEPTSIQQFSNQELVKIVNNLSSEYQKHFNQLFHFHNNTNLFIINIFNKETESAQQSAKILNDSEL
jgi:hypothetical protein